MKDEYNRVYRPQMMASQSAPPPLTTVRIATATVPASASTAPPSTNRDVEAMIILPPASPSATPATSVLQCRPAGPPPVRPPASPSSATLTASSATPDLGSAFERVLKLETMPNCELYEEHRKLGGWRSRDTPFVWRTAGENDTWREVVENELTKRQSALELVHERANAQRKHKQRFDKQNGQIEQLKQRLDALNDADGKKRSRGSTVRRSRAPSPDLNDPHHLASRYHLSSSSFPASSCASPLPILTLATISPPSRLHVVRGGSFSGWKPQRHVERATQSVR